MAHALPIAKLGALLVKTLAKPMSKRIKHEFSRYEWTREMLIGIGQSTHAITSRLTIWSAGYKVLKITPLERDVALSRGAEFFGETFVFGVAGGVLIWEYNKSKEKERVTEEKRHRKIVEEAERLQEKLSALNVRLIALEEVVKSNNERILYLGKKYVEPSKAKEVAIDDNITTALRRTSNTHSTNNASGNNLTIEGNSSVENVEPTHEAQQSPVDAKNRSWWWPFSS